MIHICSFIILNSKVFCLASLSNANFTIPTLFEYEESVTIQRESDEPDENSMKLEIRKIKPEVHGDWHAVDLGKPIHRASPLIPSSNNREDGKLFSIYLNIKADVYQRSHKHYCCCCCLQFYIELYIAHKNISSICQYINHFFPFN